VLSAINSGGQKCNEFLQGLADALHSRRQAKQKGTIAPLTIAGRDFYRADFDFGESPSHRTFLCTQSKGYLLEWNIVGLSKSDMEATLSTLNAIHVLSAKATPAVSDENAASSNQNSLMPNKTSHPMRVRVGSGVTQGLILKKVQPIYPQQARYARIQGSVVMSAIISKSGDVTDLEVLDGPIELAVSAVNAVRQWKYRPYVLNGEPVEVDTQLTVNYTLSYR
jgi:TonB family protein